MTRGSEDENSALTWSITFDDWLDAGTSAYGPDRNITVNAVVCVESKLELSMKSTGNWSKREVQEIVMSGSASRCNYTTTIGNTGVSRTLRGFTFSSADEASSIEVALAPLEAYTGTLKVSLNSTRSKATWLVTFVDFIGSPALLKCDDANVRRATEGTGNEVGGTFKLTYGDETTPSLYSNNATAVDVRTALESLSTVDEVQVVRMEKSVSDGGGLRFRVTFTGSKVDGNVDLLTTDTGGMDGTNPYATVKEVRPGGEATGTFTLLLDSVETSAIPVNASADELRAKLLEIPAIDNRGLTVTRNTTKRDGYSWTVTFLPNDGTSMMTPAGDISELTSTITTLNNSAAVSIIVTTMRDGSDPVSGTFKILFETGHDTSTSEYTYDKYYRYGSLKFDTTADEMYDHMITYFPSLPQPFTVDRIGPQMNGAYTWLVTYPINRTTAPLTFHVHYHSLKPAGTRMLTAVQQKATERLGGRFKLSFKGEETAPISAHATASELEEALSDLSNIPNITASVRTQEGFNGNKSWFVTFTSLANAGDVPLMDIDVSSVVQELRRLLRNT